LCAIHTDPTSLPVPPPTDNAGEEWSSSRFVNMPVDRWTTDPSSCSQAEHGGCWQQEYTLTVGLTCWLQPWNCTN